MLADMHLRYAWWNQNGNHKICILCIYHAISTCVYRCTTYVSMHSICVVYVSSTNTFVLCIWEVIYYVNMIHVCCSRWPCLCWMPWFQRYEKNYRTWRLIRKQSRLTSTSRTQWIDWERGWTHSWSQAIAVSNSKTELEQIPVTLWMKLNWQ